MEWNEIRPCDFCKSPVSGNTRDGMAIDFHRLVLEHLLLDQRAVQERVGMTIAMGGSEALADVFTVRREVALPVSRVELLVCNPCWTERGFDALHDLDGKGKELPKPETDRAIGKRTSSRL